MQEPLNRKERRAKAKAGDSQAQGLGPLGVIQRDNVIEALRYAVGVVEQRKRVDDLYSVDAEDETAVHRDTVDAALKEMDRRFAKLRNALKKVGFTDEQLDP